LPFCTESLEKTYSMTAERGRGMPAHSPISLLSFFLADFGRIKKRREFEEKKGERGFTEDFHLLFR